MFVILTQYKKPLSIVDQYIAEHRDFLAKGYELGYFLASGPQNPRTGGVILSLLKDKSQLETLMQQDPFVLHGIAEYEFIEFTPVKYHEAIAALL